MTIESLNKKMTERFLTLRIFLSMPGMTKNSVSWPPLAQPNLIKEYIYTTNIYASLIVMAFSKDA